MFAFKYSGLLIYISLIFLLIGKTFTAAASVVVVVASVVVLGSTFIKIMELMEKGVRMLQISNSVIKSIL